MSEPRMNGATAPMRSKILATLQADAFMPPAEIAVRTGIDRSKLSYQLSQLLAKRLIVAQGTTSTRQYALRGTVEPKAETKTPKVKTKPRKPETKTHLPQDETESPKAPACNVADFTPALTADRRLVIVGGSEPLIFSPEQTQNIATLLLDRFEA